MGKTKTELLSKEVRRLDIKTLDVMSLINAMHKTAFQARNTAKTMHRYKQPVTSKMGKVDLCLASSLIQSQTECTTA